MATTAARGEDMERVRESMTCGRKNRFALYLASVRIFCKLYGEK